MSVWQHLYSSVLSDYIINTLLLMFGVGVGVIVLGVSSAWWTSSFEFPGRKIVSLMLLLPMAMPAYIIAYTYTGLLDFAGPVQSFVRATFDWSYGDYWFFEIRSLTGAMLMLSFVLYPYVYLMSRAAFLSQSRNLVDVSRSLGVSPVKSFFKVTLPMARPAIIAGLSLVLMETLADYGTVEYFGVSTFTTGIFRTYYGLGSIAGAAQLATSLLAFVLLLVMLEKFSRRKIRYFSHTENKIKPKRVQLKGALKWIVLAWCLVPASVGFIIPALVLAYWSVKSTVLLTPEFFVLIWNSFSLAFIAAFVAVILALLLAYAARKSSSKWVSGAVQVTSLGYAMPGTIVAIGVVIAFNGFDDQLLTFIERYTDAEFELFLSGTLVAVIFAYTVRFLAVSLGSIQSGLQSIKPSIDQSAQLLGLTPAKIIRKVHVPLLKGSVLTAFLIVFVDVLKELPATLILRPFNFNTLAVRAYEFASDERLIDVGPASLTIVLVGLIPVILLNRSIIKN
ncbi:iron ABC transporter permease [Reinekea forsetii]|nr:iron ABC transporter permease [Reinekea forsetii]